MNKDDTIGIISLAGACDKNKIANSAAYFKNKGYDVILSDNIVEQNRYLAGDDDVKVHELRRFFLDKKIKLILNSRGGYGSIRLINNIDYNVIKDNPKPFCGFSDITALLLMIYKKTGLETYHSPMACSDFGNFEYNNSADKNFDNLIQAIEGNEFILNGIDSIGFQSVQGILWGGNLSTVVSLCGIDFIPDTDFIFFTEDLNEPVYKIDRMFTQLFNVEKFKYYCKGIVLGDFLNTDNKIWLDDFFSEISEKLKIPISHGYKITHGNDKATIPIGRPCCLDGKTLIIKQACH